MDEEDYLDYSKMINEITTVNAKLSDELESWQFSPDTIEKAKKMIENEILNAICIPEGIIPKEPEISAQDVIDAYESASMVYEPASKTEAPYRQVVRCVDNNGLEERLEAGRDYMAEESDDPDFIVVYDNDGNKCECFKERFIAEGMNKLRVNTPRRNDFRICGKTFPVVTPGPSTITTV